MNLTESKIIEQTINWIKTVVIDCNFCPFAAKAIFKNSIRYSVKSDITLNDSLEQLKFELQFLDDNNEFETSFLIFSNNFIDFKSYLSLVKKAEKLLTKLRYDGIYQIASFHPDYCFSDSNMNDAANYTNRSIYPMLHLLREDSITKALSLYNEPEKIPEHNIAFARQKGLQYMQILRASCM